MFMLKEPSVISSQSSAHDGACPRTSDCPVTIIAGCTTKSTSAPLLVTANAASALAVNSAKWSATTSSSVSPAQAPSNV
jgi:hypothetical protein